MVEVDQLVEEAVAAVDADLRVEAEEHPLPGRHLDYYRVPRTDRAKALVREVIEEFEAYELEHGLRRRRRRACDQEHFEMAVTAVVCDLICQNAINPDGLLVVPFSNRRLTENSRYKPSFIGKTFRQILSTMASDDLSLLTLDIGRRFDIRDIEAGAQFGRPTTIALGEGLRRQIDDRNLTLDDIGQSVDREVIILKDKKQPNSDKGKRLDYCDTDQTRRFRQEMQSINEVLRDAEITFEHTEPNKPAIHPSTRVLVRVFNDRSFERGGRLFCGFWQNVSPAQRLDGIAINEDHVVELDYGQMAIRIAYGNVGAEPPAGDLYQIEGLEDYRDGVKKVITSALSAGRQQRRMPNGVRKLIPRRISYDDVLNAILEKHEPIQELMFNDQGMGIQFQESEVLVAVLLRLNEEGIVGLPIHDSVLVPNEERERAKAIMHEVFEERFGAPIPISVHE